MDLSFIVFIQKHGFQILKKLQKKKKKEIRGEQICKYININLTFLKFYVSLRFYEKVNRDIWWN